MTLTKHMSSLRPDNVRLALMAISLFIYFLAKKEKKNQMVNLKRQSSGSTSRQRRLLCLEALHIINIF